MRSITFAAACAAALVCLPANGATARTVRILPLGDSITQGGRTGRAELTYRHPLYFMLRKAGYAVDFIGSIATGLEAASTWPDVDGVKFDPDHEGHYGWKTAQVRDRLAEWLKEYPAPPDVALIHLGTNDQGARDHTAGIVKPLADMIATLRAANPRVVVLVGHLNFNGGAAVRIRPLVEEMAKKLTTAVSPVVTVHHYRGWVENPDQVGTDTFDWVHPNPQGQKKMAEAWFARMKTYLDAMTQRRTKPR
jgi:lysophospholipase L1-like esterase